MVHKQYFKSKIFNIASGAEFVELALELFRYQSQNNIVYGDYLKALEVNPDQVTELSQIPFLPISFFKSHQVKCGSFEAQQVFTSSGTTGKQTSSHFVGDIDLYEDSCKRGFERLYEPIEHYCVLALLPSYLERSGSSLIYMAGKMIEQSRDTDSGFYLNNLEGLQSVLLEKIKAKKKTLLLGVSFALLDFAEKYKLPQNDTITVMETGGMKGRRKEMIRKELHDILAPAFGVSYIHSEYGMTEFMSQAYSRGSGKFTTPPWMKVLIRETDDPFTYAHKGKTGGINIIDLANIDSCAFVETQDLGRLYEDVSFEVMGRFDNADIRGCNLMVI